MSDKGKWFFPIEYADEEFYIRKGSDIRQVSKSDIANLPYFGSITLENIVQHFYRG